MQVQTIHVDGHPVSHQQTANPYVMNIPLEIALAPGKWIQINLTWQLRYARFQSLEYYVRLGSNQDINDLPHSHQESAVSAPGAPSTNLEGW